MRSRLLVISDTAIYKNSSEVYAYEPVVRELNAMSPMFDEIVWLGSKVDECSKVLSSSIPKNVKVVTMPSVRHKNLNGLHVLMAYPVFIFHITRYFFSATHIHTRGPSHPAVIGLLISFVDNKRKYWHKYAGNWRADNLPAMYQLQRIILKSLNKKNIKTSVNGKVPNDNAQIISFENPCLFEKEIDAASGAVNNKVFSGNLSLLFVGELSYSKGVLNVIEAVKSEQIPIAITDLYIVGNGTLFNSLQQEIGSENNIRIHLLGNLSRVELNEYYKKCHFLILPSVTEGFPKVVAEAASYGCIPVVTNISILSEYIIHGKNGFLLVDNSPATISNTLQAAMLVDDLKKISMNAHVMSRLFTYESFIKKIETEIYNANT